MVMVNSVTLGEHIIQAPDSNSMALYSEGNREINGCKCYTIPMDGFPSDEL